MSNADVGMTPASGARSSAPRRRAATSCTPDVAKRIAERLEVPLDVLFGPTHPQPADKTTRQGVGSHDEARPPRAQLAPRRDRCKDREGRLLYVGSSKTRRKRLARDSTGTVEAPGRRP